MVRASDAEPTTGILPSLAIAALLAAGPAAALPADGATGTLAGRVVSAATGSIWRVPK